MCKCALCKRDPQDILPSIIEESTKTVPILYLAGNMLPICIRCSTENTISLRLYGSPIVEYNTRLGEFTNAQEEFNDLKSAPNMDSRRHNLDIYNKVKPRYPKPVRVHLSSK